MKCASLVYPASSEAFITLDPSAINSLAWICLRSVRYFLNATPVAAVKSSENFVRPTPNLSHTDPRVIPSEQVFRYILENILYIAESLSSGDIVPAVG